MLSKAATLEQAASKSKLKEKIEPLENRFNQLCTQALDQAASEGRKEEYDFLNSILKPDNKPNLKERKTDGSLATEIAYKKVKDKLEELESILEHSDKILSAKNLDLIVVKRDSYSEQERVEMETNLLKLQVQLIEAKLLSNYSN